MATTPMRLTGDVRIDAILNGYGKWAGPTLTFSFATNESTWTDYKNASDLPFQATYSPVPNSLVANLRQAFATWSSYLGITFVEVKDNADSRGDIRLAFSTDPLQPTASLGSYPSDGAGGDVWLNRRSMEESDYGVGTGYYNTLMHEIGHALGLKHPFDKTPANPVTLPAAQDGMLNTMMAYQWDASKQYSWPSLFPTTPMPYDILAAQSLYGANPNTNAGDTVYTFRASDRLFQTIYDAGGTNAFVYEGSKSVRIDLHDGAGSYIGVENFLYGATAGTPPLRIPNVWIAYGTVISRAQGGSGDDVLLASERGSTLLGGAGNDQLHVDVGSDSLDGGAGRDMAVYAGSMQGVTINIDARGMSVIEGSGIGRDTLVNVERVRFSDGYMALDIEGNAGMAYRLYRAAFDRAPDKAGIGFWMAQLDGGIKLIDIAAGFISSAEFGQLYGVAPSNADFLSRVYQNVLHRPADQAGYDFWLGALQNGIGRAEVLAHVSESKENIEQVAALVGNGIAYIPYG